MQRRDRYSFVGWKTVILLSVFGLAVAAILTAAMANMGPALQFSP